MKVLQSVGFLYRQHTLSTFQDILRGNGIAPWGIPKKRWLAAIQEEEQAVASTFIAIVIAVTNTSITFVSY